MIQLKNVLVATDFSEPSNVALEYGRNFARSYGATLHVLHVVEDVTVRYATDLPYGLVDVQRDLEQAARKDLDAAITDDDRRTLSIRAIAETHVGAASGILEYAAENAIDLIVVGTHGRGMVKHLLMGSVAERIVRTAPCPVLTVRARERDFIAPDAMTLTAKA